VRRHDPPRRTSPRIRTRSLTSTDAILGKYSACIWTGHAIWATFVADYLVRLCLAERRLAFIRDNWFELPVLALPMLRPLRMMRGLMGLRVLARGGARFARGKVVAATGAAAVLGGAVAALALLDAERSNPEANVRSHGDALWWAISTVTTVGYGDRYPTTMEGRLVAVSLMLAGVALLGVVTASLASWFVERIGEVTRTEHGLEIEIDALRREIVALRAQIEQQGRGP
jgi:voltage-gated potassium channel